MILKNNVRHADLVLDLIISASDERGNKYYRWEQYRPSQVLTGYGFAPMERNEDLYASEYFADSLKNDSAELIPKYKKTGGVRFQNFSKIYKIPDAKNKSIGFGYSEEICLREQDLKKELISQYEIVCGTKNPLKKVGYGLYNRILKFLIRPNIK